MVALRAANLAVWLAHSRAACLAAPAAAKTALMRVDTRAALLDWHSAEKSDHLMAVHLASKKVAHWADEKVVMTVVWRV